MFCEVLRVIVPIDKLIISDLDKGEDFWSFKKDCERDYVHGLFAYPAMMVPQMQREILNIFKNRIEGENQFTIFDPFMGSGTIMVEGMLQGANIIGVDINPLAYLVSKVKTTIYSITALENSIKRLFREIQENEKTPVETNFDNINKWFKEDVILGLDHIKKQIENEKSLKLRRYMWVAFSETVRTVSNSRSSTYKLHIKDEKAIDEFDKDSIEIFKIILTKNLDSTKQYQNKLQELGYIIENGNHKKYIGEIKIILGNSLIDSKRICKKFNPNLIITSPPYGDNHTTVTYGQYSVLSLKWINMNDIVKDIDNTVVSTLSEIDKRSMGGKKYESINTKQCSFLEASPTLKYQLNEIESIDKNKVNKILSFYNDFYIFIKSIEIVSSNTYVVMTVGNRTVAKTKIKMDEILNELFIDSDFEFIYKFDRNILNKRMPVINHTDKETGHKSETMTKEYVLIFKKR